MEISGKHALVTGAGAGIGRATVIALAQKGAKVVAADINEDGLKETAALVQQAVPGANVVTVKADVSTAAGVRAMFASATAAFGGLDIVHNNAGLICGEPLWPDAALEKISAVIAVNLGGVAMGTQEAIKALRARGGGAIVNTASVAALQAMPTDPVYSATKVGVVRIVESCAGFAAEGIRVNAVLPGMVDTDMQSAIRAAQVNEVSRVPREQLGKPERAARLIAWLANQRPIDLNGQDLSIRDAELVKRAGIDA